MSFDAEWAQIKQEVSGAPVTTLAHADGGGGAGGDGDLVSDEAAWKAAAQGVKGLVDNLAKAGTTLFTAQEGMGTSLQAFDNSFQTLAAQDELHATWSGYLTSLQGKCAALESKLFAAGATLRISDIAVKPNFPALDTQFTDTPAVGGQS
jgi:hypothetical protein